jgi:hypothetical protein
MPGQGFTSQTDENKAKAQAMPELEANAQVGGDMDDATKLATAEKLKVEGNQKVKEGDCKSAKFLYGYAISMIE